MSSSTSDYEMSDYSNSPMSNNVIESPHSSPVQHVPQITNHISEMSCSDKDMYLAKGLKPELRIIEQPQSQFRFRYVSEMVGTHGCILGRSCSDKKTKTHPTVELVNYTGKAEIRCSLAQYDKPADHPHRLHENEYEQVVSHKVPENGSYIVGFAGMGIIHTAKKDVPKELFKKLSEEMKHKNYDPKLLQADCDRLAKKINLNKVRLKFSAHEVETGRRLCEPVYSEPISNMKSAETNVLKICRMSACYGNPNGGEEVIILVEKVVKKNIQVRFFELNERREEVWSAFAKFKDSDVHHQYAITFNTPAYKNPKTLVDVNVFIELVAPKDGRTSEPRQFVYKADTVLKQMQMHKKRKYNSLHSSLDSTSSSSLSNLPPVSDPLMDDQDLTEFLNISIRPLPNYLGAGAGGQCELGSALSARWAPALPCDAQYSASPAAASHVPSYTSPAAAALTHVPPYPGPAAVALPHIASCTGSTAAALPVLELRSGELDRVEVRDGQDTIVLHPTPELWDKLGSFSSFSDLKTEDSLNHSIQYVADSGRVKTEPSTFKESSTDESNNMNFKDTSDEEYPVYKVEDGMEVKKLIKEICSIIRSKKGYESEELKNKFDRLFDIRLPNGDTFLHMALCSEEPSFQSIVKVIHRVKMTHLLNYVNNKQKTILHLAVIYGTPRMVTFLISKGCNPALKDCEEENAIHYAVKYKPECLEPLLQAIDTYKVPCDLNDCNSDGESALHLCVLYDAAGCVSPLVRAGASTSLRDMRTRTPLHLAAINARHTVLKQLLDVMPESEVDLTDGFGNTALQIVCDSTLNEHSVEMVKMLLEHKADPLKHTDCNKSAWQLCHDKPALREVMVQYVPAQVSAEVDVKSEPEDEFESADEEGGSLRGLQWYCARVCACVGAAGKHAALARRLSAYMCGAPPACTHLLLRQLQKSGTDLTSKSLALILDDMGLVEAANIIRSCIE